jgi:hypothetical protein
VVWVGSAGGSGHITVANSTCINTNASCNIATSIPTGNIYFGGGTSGSAYPTGPAVTTSTHAVLFGTTQPSGIQILSGGGNVEIRGTTNSANYGVVFFTGFEMRSTTGAITIVGSTNTAAYQGVRIANAGTSTITSARLTGDAISITGSNTSGSATAQSTGIGIGYSATSVNISATGGGDVRLLGTVNSNTAIQATYLNNANVSSSGGDIFIVGDYAELNTTRLDASSGGSIQIKSSHHIGVLTGSTIETSGPSSGSGGQISIWSDSNGDDTGVIHTSGVTCINTINSCSAAATSGGADIVIGGGSTADSSGFFPTGGAPAGTTSGLIGVRLSEAHGADRTKIWSGGGDISIASKTSTANMIYGQ